MAMTYGRLADGQLTMVSNRQIVIDGVRYNRATDEMLAKVGIYPIEYIQEDGTDEVVDGVILHYIGKPVEREEVEDE